MRVAAMIEPKYCKSRCVCAAEHSPDARTTLPVSPRRAASAQTPRGGEIGGAGTEKEMDPSPPSPLSKNTLDQLRALAVCCELAAQFFRTPTAPGRITPWRVGYVSALYGVRTVNPYTANAHNFVRYWDGFQAGARDA